MYITNSYSKLWFALDFPYFMTKGLLYDIIVCLELTKIMPLEYTPSTSAIFQSPPSIIPTWQSCEIEVTATLDIT